MYIYFGIEVFVPQTFSNNFHATISVTDMLWTSSVSILKSCVCVDILCLWHIMFQIILISTMWKYESLWLHSFCVHNRCCVLYNPLTIIKNGTTTNDLCSLSYIFLYGNFDIYFEFGTILLENLLGVIYSIHTNTNYRYQTSSLKGDVRPSFSFKKKM